MTYIVSGATGFIGRNLINRLSSVDNTVYALIYEFDCLEIEFQNKSNIIPVVCNLENSDNDFSRIPEHADVFFHFAWLGVKPECRKNFDIQYRNIHITKNCLQLAKEKKVKKFLSPGTTNEYLYSGSVINKNTIPTPRDSYGSVKVALRYLQKQFCENEKIHFLYVIIAGIYSEYRRDNNVISYTIESLLQNKSPSLTKCEQLWDYVHIDDVIDALVAVSERGSSDKAYAIGHGDNWALSNYIELIHNIINPSIPIRIGNVPYNSSVLPMSCIDLTDIQTDTDWKPKIDFETGIKRVIENWFNI